MTPGCTCHWLDIGPRCAACVRECAAGGHPDTEAKTNGVHCRCGTPRTPQHECGRDYDPSCDGCRVAASDAGEAP